MGFPGDNLRVIIAGPVSVEEESEAENLNVNVISVAAFGAKLDGVTDDSAAWQQGVNTLAGTGISLWQPGGTTSKVSSPVTLKNKLSMSIIGYGATILSALTPSGPGGFTQCPFFANYATVGAASTLSGIPTIGGYTIPVNANTIANGSTIVVTSAASSGLVQQQFIVKSGGGTATLTVDEPVEFTFAAADAISMYDVPTKISIAGFTFTGTGDRAIEIARGYECQIIDCSVTTSGGSFAVMAMSYDVGGRQNTYNNVTVDGGAITLNGLALENQVGSSMLGCTIRNCKTGTTSNCGVFMPTCARCTIDRVMVNSCEQGCLMTYSYATDPDSCRGCTVNDSSFVGNNQQGIYIQGGRGNLFENTQGLFNGQNGFNADQNGLGGPAYAQLSNCVFSDNTLSGVIATNANLTAVGLHCSRNQGALCAVYVPSGASIVTIDGYMSDDNVAGPWLNSGGSLTITGGIVRNITLVGNWFGYCNGGVTKLCNYEAYFTGGTGSKVLAFMATAGATVYLENCRTIGNAGNSFGVFSGNGVATKVWRGTNVDLSSATTPYSLDVQTLANFGTFVANGVTQVDIAGFFLADQSIATSLKTSGGTPAAPFQSAAQTSGSAHYKSLAGDTSTYNWHAY